MDSDENFSSKRRRVARACDTCRRKKIRCDGVQPGSDPPSCTNCKAYGYDCSFIDAPKKRGPPKGYIEALESRLQRMESILGGLVQSGELPETALPSNLEWINVDESSFRSRDGRNLHKASGYDQPVRNDPATAATASSPGLSPGLSNHGGRGGGGGARGDYHYGVHRNRSMTQQSLSDSEDDSDDVRNDDDDEFSDNGSQVGDCLGDRMGQLSIDEQGVTRYLGGSSNICFLRLTNTVERGQAIVINRRDFEKPWPNDKPHSPEVYVLPPRELCDRLIDTYFKYVHTTVPFVDKGDFMEKYNNLESNPSLLILLYAMLASASTFMDEPAIRSDPNDASTGGLDYFMRARALLKEEFDDPTLYTVQAILLMTGTHLSAKNSAAWVYGGLAIRIAQDMGLHRDSSKWNLDARQTEVRKRTWWVCFAFDRAISATLGRPVIVHESDFDVRLPTAGAMPDDEESTVEEFTVLIKLIIVMGRVLQHVYSIRCKRSSGKDPEATLLKLDGELNAWRDALPQRMRYDQNMSLRDLSNQRFSGLHMMYYAVQILLHRPHIRGPGSKAPPSSVPSLTICTVAANNISHTAYRSMKDDVLRIWWSHALYAFFNATVMHVINALSGDERFREVAKHGLRMSLKCLEYLRPYWCAANQCIILIRELLQTRNVNLDDVGFLGDKNGTGRTDGNGSSGSGSGSGGGGGGSDRNTVGGRSTSSGRKLSNSGREPVKIPSHSALSYADQVGDQPTNNRTIVFAPSVTGPDDDPTGLADFSALNAQMRGSATTTPPMIPSQTSPRLSSQHGSPLLGEDPSPSPASSTSSCNHPGFLEFAPADFFNTDATAAAAANSSVAQALANFFPTNADQFHSTTTGVGPPLLLAEDDPIGNGNPFWSVPAGIDLHDWSDYLRSATGGPTATPVVGMAGAVNGIGSGGGNELNVGASRTKR